MPTIHLGGQKIDTSDVTKVEIICHPTTADELDRALRLMLGLDETFGQWELSNVGTTLWVSREIPDEAEFTVFGGSSYSIGLSEFKQRIEDIEREGGSY